MSGRRTLGAALLLAAAVAGFVAWRRAAAPGPEAAPTASAPSEAPARARAPRRERRENAATPPDGQDPPAPAPDSAAEEPSPTGMIDIPAGPPPEQGAGDDMEESGLPRALFEAKVALEALAPSPSRIAAAEARLGRRIEAEEREALAAAFLKHDEQAAAALGDFRLGTLAEEEAGRAIARARARYLAEAAAALGVSAAAVERALDSAAAP